MPTLVRTLRLRDLLFLFIGSVIGSGIFLSPGPILKLVNGSIGLSMLVWIAGGAMSLLGALTYAELAAANPEAGGLYCYIRDSFGRLPAFLYGWCLFLVISAATIAALARAFARYLTEIIPLAPMESNAAAVLMIAVVTVVNVMGTRQSSDLQNWTTLMKGGLVVVLSVLLLVLGKHGGEIIPAAGTQMRGMNLFSSFSLAMIAVLWAYEGWQFGTYSAGEVIEPQKVFPRAFLLGSLILIALYVVALMPYLVALGPEVASNSDAIAATAAKAVLGPWAGKLVALTILISVFSATNSVVLTAPRVFYAMSKDNLFFKTLSGQRHCRAMRLVNGPDVCREIFRAGFWSGIHRLDFLWAGRGGNFSSARGAWGVDEGVALSRTRIPVDADCVFAGGRGCCWECDFSGGA